MITMSHALSLRLLEGINSSARYETKEAQDASAKEAAISSDCNRLKEKGQIIEEENQNSR